MENPFHNAGLKLKRANEHIQDLYIRMLALGDSGPYTIVVNRDPNGGDDSIEIESTQSVPDDVLLIIGDALHNLRSALDYALYSITVNRDRHSKFPVCKTRENLKSA